MAILIFGVLLWWAAHLFKRFAPAQRTALQERFGDGARGILAGAILLSIILMVLGYRMAEPGFAYAPPVWGIHLNNLLMLIAIGLVGVGHSKSRLKGRIRHPMLLGFLLWCIAHLLVNGDTAALALFVLLGLWAVTQIIIINRAEPAWQPTTGGTLAGDVRLGLITLGVYAVVGAIHTWLGYWPFPG